MHSMLAKLAVVLAAALVGLGGLLIAVTPFDLDPQRLADLLGEAAIAGIVFALLAALGMHRMFTHRLRRFTAALEAYERGDGPLRTAEAETGADDEMARLAAAIERLGVRLEHQQLALERAARQHRELIANVSHDLRTPLASMQGYLELLLLREISLDSAEARNHLQTAARQSERLGRLVADLFELTRLGADDVALDAEDFAGAELAHDLAQRFAAEAERRGVRLEARVDGAAAACFVHADMGLTERVLASLVENALRHTPSGGAVTVAIAPAAGRVQMRVEDTGEGIAAADLPGLFERYYLRERVGEANRATGHGGLGLAIARRIVELHGGALSVESTPGIGTRIGFDLPPAGAEPGAIAAAPAVAPAVRERAAVAAKLAGTEARCEALRAEAERSDAARRAAEADVRATEQRYLLALRGSQDGLWEWDLASGAVHLSPRWKSMLGFESHEVADAKAGWFGRVHPADRAAFEAALARHLNDSKTRFDESLRLLHKDGSVRSVLSRGVAIRGDDGVPYRMVGIDTDVTELQRVKTVLDAVAEGTAAAHGEDFFPAMVRHFARALEVEMAFITECADEPVTRVRTLAAWSADRGEVANFEYALAGTPCAEVVGEGRICFHREGVSKLFPREAGWESFLGLPIIGSDGRMLGHLAFFDSRPRGDDMLVDSIYRIFLARAAAEIERSQALRRLALSA